MVLQLNANSDLFKKFIVGKFAYIIFLTTFVLMKNILIILIIFITSCNKEKNQSKKELTEKTTNVTEVYTPVNDSVTV